MLFRSAALVLLSALFVGCGALADPGDDVGGVGRPQPISTRGPALYAQVAERMEAAGTVTFTFSGVGGGETVSGKGSMRLTGTSFHADVQVTMPETGRVRAVVMPKVAYLALPSTKQLPRSKPWLRISQPPGSALGREMGPVIDQLRAAFDPEQGVGLLRAARRVEEVGPATVEDVATTHYSAVIDLRRVTEITEGGLREQYQSMLDAGVQTLEYDLWADLSGLPRRFTIDIATTDGLYSVTGIYRGWGKEVHIEKPKPKEVFDADELKG